MIRYGILGFGLHAVRRLMPGFSQAKHCTVTGLWRRDQRKAQEAVKQFDSAGGNIINISSTVTSLTPPGSSVYTGTKGAVDAITRTLAKELGPRKIRVNAINPGMVETEGVRAAGFDQGDLRKSVEAQTPLGRIGQPEDIAPAAVFLASSDSAWITGETLRVAGGLR